MMPEMSTSFRRVSRYCSGISDDAEKSSPPTPAHRGLGSVMVMMMMMMMMMMMVMMMMMMMMIDIIVREWVRGTPQWQSRCEVAHDTPRTKDGCSQSPLAVDLPRFPMFASGCMRHPVTWYARAAAIDNYTALPPSVYVVMA
jgi:hypothetical protein